MQQQSKSILCSLMACFTLLAMQRKYPNVLTSMALNFICIDFWVSIGKLYAISLDLFFSSFIFDTVGVSWQFCMLLINRQVTPQRLQSQENMELSTLKSDIYHLKTCVLPFVILLTPYFWRKCLLKKLCNELVILKDYSDWSGDEQAF